MNEAKTSWTRLLATALATLTLGAGSGLAYHHYAQADACCKEGAACCKPGAECCHRHRAQGDAQNVAR